MNNSINAATLTGQSTETKRNTRSRTVRWLLLPAMAMLMIFGPGLPQAQAETYFNGNTSNYQMKWSNWTNTKGSTVSSASGLVKAQTCSYIQYNGSQSQVYACGGGTLYNGYGSVSHPTKYARTSCVQWNDKASFSSLGLTCTRT